ncbi:AbiH family protein [Pedobacter glucosidilyticus]|uniref:AbiH family protein n=1 Tax=Pedobacter glucosidilyticus TaxID=1122941 RepID=UPI0026F08563|nr:AbiH family protein [Pedobacter glucosidilyticus]
MNRLILIGNGFDLAHGLKTSYKDFILWYLAGCLEKTTTNKPYKDELISISGKGFNHYFPSIPTKEWVVNEYNAGTLNKFLKFSNAPSLDIVVLGSDYYDSTFKEPLSIQIIINSELLCRVLNECLDFNWVDIETEYFDVLKKCKLKNSSFEKDTVLALNQEFSYLKKKLEEYIELQQQDFQQKLNPEILGLMTSKFSLSEFDTILDGESYNNLRRQLNSSNNYHYNPYPKKTYFLNFNYTSTVEIYLEHLKQEKHFSNSSINYIHGKLNDPRNPIIFGFGDEYDKEYLNFEEQKNQDIFQFIKSYQYFKTSNYRNLARFLNSEEYQIYVLGHSCGLSDRTMFKEIFEHKNCKSIKIFHYKKSDGTDDFEEKTINLSRHFGDKGYMRKLIVEFKKTDAFPQL